MRIGGDRLWWIAARSSDTGTRTSQSLCDLRRNCTISKDPSVSFIAQYGPEGPQTVDPRSPFDGIYLSYDGIGHLPRYENVWRMSRLF